MSAPAVAWSAELVEKAWDVCCCVFDLRTCKLLEQKLRKGTGTEHWGDLNSCSCSATPESAAVCAKHQHRQSLSQYCFRKHPDDRLGEILHQMTTKTFFVQDHLIPVFEEAASLYHRVVVKKLAEMPSEAEASVETLPSAADCASVEVANSDRMFASSAEKAGLQAACLTNAIERVLTQKVQEHRTHSERFNVRDGGQLAYPQSYKLMFPKSHFLGLDSVSSSHMVKLMGDEKWTVIPNWTKDLPAPKRSDKSYSSAAAAIADDLEWVEMHNILENMTPFAANPHRTDSAVWLNVGALPAELSGLALLAFKMTSLPFEMNQKTQAKLTINNNLFFALYKPEAFHLAHVDNMPGTRDNGRTFTFVYAGDKNVPMEVDGKTITLSPDDVLVMRSKSVQYSVPAHTAKRWLVYYWCHGLNDIE